MKSPVRVYLMFYQRSNIFISSRGLFVLLDADWRVTQSVRELMHHEVTAQLRIPIPLVSYHQITAKPQFAVQMKY